MLQLHPSLNHKVLGRILEDILWNTSSALLDLRPSAEFSGKIQKFLRSIPQYLPALAFLCCHIFSFNTAYVHFHSHFFVLIALSSNYFSHFQIHFKSIQMLFRASKVCQGALLTKILAGVSEHLQTPRSPAPLTLATFTSLQMLSTPGIMCACVSLEIIVFHFGAIFA